MLYVHFTELDEYQKLLSGIMLKIGQIKEWRKGCSKCPLYEVNI